MKQNEKNEYMSYIRDNKIKKAHEVDEEQIQRMAINRSKMKNLKKMKSLIFIADVFFVLVVFVNMFAGLFEVRFGTLIQAKNLAEIIILSIITVTKSSDESIFKKAIIVSIILFLFWFFAIPFDFRRYMTLPYIFYVIQSLICILLARKELELMGEEGYPYFQDIGIKNFEGRTKAYIPTHFSNETKGRKMDVISHDDMGSINFNGKNTGSGIEMGGLDTEYIGNHTEFDDSNRIEPNDLNGADHIQRPYDSGKMDEVSIDESSVVLSGAENRRISDTFMEDAGLH